MLRMFWGFIAGTVLNLGWVALLTYWNGTPVPSVRTPAALVAYPTGSVTATLVIAGIIYFLCLAACILMRKTR